MMNQRAAAQRGRRRAKLERKARADVERVAKLEKGNGSRVRFDPVFGAGAI